MTLLSVIFDVIVEFLYFLSGIPGVPQKAERSIFVTLIFENIAYFDFIRQKIVFWKEWYQDHFVKSVRAIYGGYMAVHGPVLHKTFMLRSHCRSDQLDQGRSSQITHFTQSKLDQMLDRTSTRALPDRYSIVYDPHPTIHDSSRTSPRQPHRSLLEHTDLYTINTRSINGQYSNSTRPPRPTRRLHDLYKILTRADRHVRTVVEELVDDSYSFACRRQLRIRF